MQIIGFFDYNRQLHKGVLSNNKNIKNKRILLKIHFILYDKNKPKYLINLYKKILTMGNYSSRNIQSSKYNIIKTSYIKNFILKPLNI